MKPEAQRIAIAETLGWISVRIFRKTQDETTVVGYSPNNPFPHDFGEETVPDYLNDLNAINKAEDWIKKFENMMLYRDCLFIAAGLNPIIWAHDCPAPEFLRVATLPASKRAEAFLRTIGKWVEE